MALEKHQHHAKLRPLINEIQKFVHDIIINVKNGRLFLKSHTCKFE